MNRPQSDVVLLGTSMRTSSSAVALLTQEGNTSAIGL